MVRLRDAAKVAGMRKAEMAALARDLDDELERARENPTAAGMQALLDRLEATAAKWRDLAAVYEPFVAWDAEPS
jgi:hypothetical protein